MGGIVALAGLALWGFSYKQEHEKRAHISLPNGTEVSGLRSSLNYKLAVHLGSRWRDTAKTFRLDHVSFQPSSTDLTQGSIENLSDLAMILKAYPEVHIHLADRSGIPARPNLNQKLPLDRANAVKGVLVSAGVDPERILTTRFVWTGPRGTGEAEHGLAKHRGLNLTVMPARIAQPKPA